MSRKEKITLDYQAIGNRIKELRGGERREEFGLRFGKPYNDIGRFERAEVKPSSEFLIEVCAHYRKPLEWLLTGESFRLDSERAEENESTHPLAGIFDRIRTLHETGDFQKLAEIQKILATIPQSRELVVDRFMKAAEEILQSPSVNDEDLMKAIREGFEAIIAWKEGDKEALSATGRT